MIRRRPLLSAIVIAGLAGATALATPAAQAQDEPFKVGFVYVGPVGDHGWTYQHDQGRQALEAHFGDAVETTFVENVSEGADTERVIRQLVTAGHDMIFTTSFGFMNATAAMAEQFPDVIFEHATGYKRADNLATYLSVTYQGRYVSGFLAGKLSETGKIGYIASFPIPEVIRDINAVMLGAARGPRRCRDGDHLGQHLVRPGQGGGYRRGHDRSGRGCHHPAHRQPGRLAGRRGARGLGRGPGLGHDPVRPQRAHHRRGQRLGRPTTSSGCRRRWTAPGRATTSGAAWPRTSSGWRRSTSAVPADVAAEAMAIADSIKDGSFHPFSGPIKNQAGEVVVPEGTTMTNEELAGMNWYVEGIDRHPAAVTATA